LGLAIGGIAHAFPGDRHPADRDLELVAHGLLARFADRHDDPAPIGILAGDRRLDQRRIGDCHADLARRRIVLRPGDLDLNELLRPLAVLHDLQCEIVTEAIKPEPLAMPLIVTGTPANREVTVDILAKVSVVMIARAASPHASARADCRRRGNAALMGAGSSGSPITPVEAWNISAGLHFRNFAAALAI